MSISIVHIPSPLDKGVSPLDSYISSYFLRPVKAIEELEQFYIFEEPEKIRTFLLTHKKLIPFLQDAFLRIQRIFGPNTPVYLELQTDPEENFEELFIIIETYLPVEQAVHLLERLDEEWGTHLPEDISVMLEETIRLK